MAVHGTLTTPPPRSTGKTSRKKRQPTLNKARFGEYLNFYKNFIILFLLYFFIINSISVNRQGLALWIKISILEDQLK